VRRALSLGAVCGLIGLIAVAVASGGAKPTAVHYYVAWKDGRLAPGLKIIERVHGRCDNASEVEGRPFVWRCVWGNVLADPCFSSTATSKTAFCPDAPWRKQGALVLVKRLHGWKPTHPEVISTWPWGIWTTNGKHCIAIRTGTSFVAGMRVNHGCQDGGVLIGPVNRHTTPWTIYASRYLKNGTYTKLVRVGITDAWW
jgi:hypothetical protein